MNFKEKVYSIVKTIPKGKVTTYFEIGKALNSRAFQAIGQILAKNDNGFYEMGNVPCHRVVTKKGELGGFYGQKSGEATIFKKSLLQEEGIIFDENNHILNFEEVLHKF